MIYTLTANPSLDVYVKTDVVPGTVNRSRGDSIYPGGKGINVSVVLSRLGCKNTAIVPVAGSTGEMLKNMLHKVIDARYVYLDEGITRINMKALGDKSETEINGKGVAFDVEKLKLSLGLVTRDDILAVCGSFADYSLIDSIAGYVDTKKLVFDIPRIEHAIKHSPFVIKPNIRELEEYFGGSIETREVEKYAQRLIELGCRNVLVSMGSEGAFFCNRNYSFYVPAFGGECVNSVGSGDSMLAGLLYGIEKGMTR